MNKKFSTLVASLLLASSVGAYAADVTATSFTTAIKMVADEGLVKPIVAEYDEVHPVPVYQVGQSYYLGVGGDASKILSLSENGLYLTVITVSNAGLDFTQSERALWVLKSLEAPAGAVAPKYVFVNKATGAVLAMDAEDAITYSDDNYDDIDAPTPLGGTVAEWMSAISYSKPAPKSPLYAAASDGNFLALVTKTLNEGTPYEETVAVLTKMTRKQLFGTSTTTGVANAADGKILTITPCTLGDDHNSFILSANQLNTLLGKTGDMATRSNYFSLDFDPVATVNGEDNLWSQDLQAVAVEQFDVKYSDDPSKSKVIIVPATSTQDPTVDGLGFTENAGAYYASLRPLWDSNLTSYTADCFNKIAQEGPYEAVNNREARWLTVRNRDNKYLVVDTTYINGTNTLQQNNGLMTFAWDGLYNTQNDTRRRDPRSYLFQFIYNPVTEQIQVVSMAHAKYNDDPITTSTNVETWHTEGNKEQFVKAGTNWYFANDASANNRYIVHAGLGATHEVTLAANDRAPVDEDAFSIKLSLSKYMTPSAVATGAYLIKEVGSGKYWVTNLAGEFELVEQAPRQNFQDMPSAQWIVKSAGTTAGSPVLWIANREFGSEPERVSSGTLFENARGKYFAGSATLEFIPVENTKDSHLGYKYVANDTIRESLFSFNYLHDLAMDKPINTLNDKDSALWVDANGNKMSFVLERVLDDTYGFNGDIDGIAELTRTAYRIKVNDATKLQNDGRYLTYNPSLKKFVVSADDPSEINLFWLKENNEVKGGECYYTFLKANVWPVVGVEENDDHKFDITKRPGYVAMDQKIDDCDGLYLAEYGKYTSPSDGIVNGTEGWTLRIFTKSQADAFLANYPELAAADFLKVVSVQDAKINSVNGEYEDETFDRKNMYVIAVALTEAEGNDALLTIVNDGAYDYDTDVTNYAISKVSVDNNTLALVNGVLEDAFYAEVANSAFSVVRNADPLYRHFAEPQVVKFFRTNSSAPEYLYEDANSSYSAGLGFNFLGVEGKGDQKNAAMYLDTAYVDRGTRMPQYLIALAPTVVEGDTVLCDATTHQHATVEEALACDHSKTTRGYITARYLVNLQDSVVAHANDENYSLRNKFIYDKNYTRLGFVEATHIGDSLIIKNSMWTGNTDKLEAGKPATKASQDTINLANNLHKNVVFSFRIAKSGSDDFLIESETEGLNNAGTAYEHKANADLKAARIAPELGGWLKIQNGVPVIANNGRYDEVGRDADIFNLEATDEAPTANEAVAASEVSVVAVNGAIIVKGAAGKVVTVANVLGQTIANQVAASDNVTIAAPAGVAIVTVDGEATKVIVK